MKKIYISLLALCASAASIAQVSCIQSSPNMNVSNYTPCANQTVTLTCSGGALSSPNTGQRWYWAEFSSSNCSGFNATNVITTIGANNINTSGINNTTYVITKPITYIGIIAMGGACGTDVPCTNIMTITRQNGPAIMLPSGAKYFCSGTAASITATVTGTPISYAWYKGATAVTGATTSVLSFTNPSAVDAGSYTLRSTNACGTTTSSAVTFTTLGNQAISGGTIALASSTLAYTVTNLATSGVTYNWALPAGGGTITAGATTSSATINWGSTVGIYTVEVTKTLGTCSVTDTKTVSVEVCNTNPVLIYNTTTGNTSTICPGTTVAIVASATGTFTWSTNPPQYSAGISVSPSVTTTYSVQSNDLSGCPKSGTITVLVGALPQLTVTASHSIICAGETATITAAGANTYAWSGNGSSASITVTPSVSTTYSLTGSNANCSSNSQISITVSPCTGINEFDSSKFLIYPNPAKNYVIIEASSILYYEIYNSIGVKVAMGTIDEKQNQIDVSNLSKGVYIMQLNDGKTKGVKRIIKE